MKEKGKEKNKREQKASLREGAKNKKNKKERENILQLVISYHLKKISILTKLGGPRQLGITSA